MAFTAESAINAVNAVFGSHAGARALHAKGIVCKATFTPDPAAAPLTRAAHMHSGALPATVRFSNAAGDPTHPDWLPDPRGMAIKLYLPDGGRTDIVAVSSPRLPVATPERFIEMIKAQGPGPRPGLGLPLFLAKNPKVLLALPALAPTLALRSSYAGITYYGIHAFRWLDAEGHVTNVRYVLGPAAPAAKLSAKAAKQGGPDYLQHELRDRLATGPARFTLSLIIGEVGDPTDDPSAAWPASRRRVSAGQLTLEAIDGERDTGDDVLVFDPTRVVDGIECSDDPVLKFRGAAYTESVARRMRSS